VAQSDRTKWNERYQSGAYAERTHPSALLEEWIDRIPRGRALDVACGAGRNALFLAANGFDVDAVDISVEALNTAGRSAQRSGLHINWIEHDLDEALELNREYALILVIRYVNLPLIRKLAASLAPGGFLLCEQHLETNTEVAGPSNPAYRVKPGALQTVARGLQIHYLEEAVTVDPDKRPVALARLVAQRPDADAINR
jgi:SAM-dependent methyltransferase